MKKGLFLSCMAVFLLVSSEVQSKEYECDVGNGKTVTSTLLDMGAGDMGYVECKKGKLYVRCSAGLEKVLPECAGKSKWDTVEVGNGDPVSGYQQLSNAMEQVKNQRQEDENSGVGACNFGNGKLLNNHGESTSSGQYVMCRDGKLYLEKEQNGNISESTPISTTEACKYFPEMCPQTSPTPPASITSPSDTDYVDKTTDIMNSIKDNVASGHDWSGYAGQSVNNGDNSDNNSAAQPTGSATSGNVAKYVGSSSLGDDYGMRDCTAGTIFDQLGCRAGVIGRGLQSVGYLIAGFGLLAFSLSALFGKVKWPVFVTIMFSVFLLSMTIYVINTFTRSGNAGWIGGVPIKSTGYNSAESLQQNIGNVDQVSISKDN